MPAANAQEGSRVNDPSIQRAWAAALLLILMVMALTVVFLMFDMSRIELRGKRPRDKQDWYEIYLHLKRILN